MRRGAPAVGGKANTWLVVLLGILGGSVLLCCFSCGALASGLWRRERIRLSMLAYRFLRSEADPVCAVLLCSSRVRVGPRSTTRRVRSSHCKRASREELDDLFRDLFPTGASFDDW